MTPILLHFGIAPVQAVGTDLLYAAVTKSNGVFVHQRKGNVDWGITVRLAAGNLPAAIATLIGIRYFQDHSPSRATDALITMSLGIALLFTAMAVVFKQPLLDWSHRNDVLFTRMSLGQRRAATYVIGAGLGVVVSITSIGAGALGTMALFLVYPLLPTSKLVGTEIAHAVPLTLIAGLGHAGALPDKWLRPALAAMLVYAGVKLIAK